MPSAIKPFCQPIPSSSRLTTTAASAGPSPHDAIIRPMPMPRCRRNQYIAEGIRGTRNIACAVPSSTPKYRYSSQMVLICPGEQHAREEHRCAHHHRPPRTKSVAEPARKRRSQGGHHARNRVCQRDAPLAPLEFLLQWIDEHSERHANGRAHHLHHRNDTDNHPDIVRINGPPVVRLRAACGWLRLSCHWLVFKSLMQRACDQEEPLPSLPFRCASVLQGAYVLP